MKKLLIMASLFWPQKNSGGPPISILNLVRSIKDSFDIYIISKNHEINDDKPLEGITPGWNQFEFGNAIYLSREEHTLKRVRKIIEDVNPDVIYQNSFFSYDDLLPVLFYKKAHKQVKVIVAPRGEFYPERIMVGKTKKKIYGFLFRVSGLLKDVYFQGTGKEECDQEKMFLGIPDDHLLNIQNLSISAKTSINIIEKNSGELKLVYIARVHPTKNLLKAIEWLKNLDGNVQYDIYGSIEDDNYWEDCLQVIHDLPENIKVSYLGVVEHELVASLIEKYHVYYMPTTGENFGHSIVEALRGSRPVLISDQTPWTDIDGVGGYAIALNENHRFESVLKNFLYMSQDEYNQMCDNAHKYITEKLDVDSIKQQYIEAFSGA